MSRHVPLSMLPSGAVLAQGISDEGHRLLLAAGVPVTQELTLGLYKRGFRTVIVSDEDWQRLTAFGARGTARAARPGRSGIRSEEQNAATRELDSALDGSESCDIVPSADPFIHSVSERQSGRYESAAMNRIFQRHLHTVEQVRDLFTGLRQGKTISAEVLNNLSEDALLEAADDMDLFVCMGINPTADSSLFAHSTHVSMLAVAIGAALGLDKRSLQNLGIGCLVHDAGMLHITPAIYMAKRVLESHEFYEIARHPIISADLLARNTNVPQSVRMIVYQMHERCNGSGYPRGSTTEMIHPLARIAAVADTYVALVSDRPYRPALLPYWAMSHVIKDVAVGLFDSKVVRALVHVTSLFPIGSYVLMSNGMVGKTIRSNGPVYDRPVVECCFPEHPNEGPQIIDLTQHPELRITQPLTAPALPADRSAGDHHLSPEMITEHRQAVEQAL
jgi:HD-GYP domain-containing protein (c-di-GMP phosphodiesterase class II)